MFLSLPPLARCLLAGAALLAAPPDEADDAVRYIHGLYERGLYDLVADEAGSFLQDHARHGSANDVRYRLASALFELQRLDEARPQFRTLSRRAHFGFRAESCLRLGQCELAAGRPDAAAEALQRVLDLDADYLRAPATFLLGEAAFRRERWSDAARHYEALLQLEPEGDHAADARLALAWCAFRTQQHDRTVQWAETLLATDPEPERAAELQFLAGEAHLAAGRQRQAEAAYGAVTSGPFADAALRGLGFSRAARDDHAGAAQAFQRLVERHPDSRFAEEARLRAGIHRLQGGDAVGAWKLLRAETLPRTAETLYWRARTRWDMGDLDAALGLLDEARVLRPDKTLAGHIHSARGDLLARAGRAREAARAYEQAGSAAGTHAAAVARLNAGDAPGALELADRLLAQGTADPAVRLTRAEALFALQRYAEALPAFERLAEQGDPAQRTRAASRAAWCRHQRGDAAGAADAFARVVRADPEAPEAAEALYMQGLCLEQAGRPAEAAEPFTRYLRLHRDGPHAADAHLGLTRVSPGAQAEQHLRAVLKLVGAGERGLQARFELAEHLAERGQHGPAAEQYRKLLEQAPRHARAPAARYGLAWNLLEAEQADQAAEVLAFFTPRGEGQRKGRHEQPRAPVLEPELLVSALELQVWCQRQRGDGARAEQAWRHLAATKVEPGRLLEAARAVAATWKATGQPQRGLVVFDQLVTRSAVRTPALLEAAWIELDLGRLDAAEQRLRPLLGAASGDPAVAEACFFLAEARFDAGDPARAAPLYQAAARHDGPLLDKALYKEGFARLQADDPAGAEGCFARLVQQHEDSELAGEAAFLAGEAAFRADRWVQAVPWLRRVLEQSPGHQVAPKARYRLGLALARLQRWDEAAQVLGELARRHPGFEHITEAELWRGRALAAQGQTRAARSAFERVLAADQAVFAARARLELGRMALRAGETEAALSDFLKVAVLYSPQEEGAEALLLAGQCLDALGQPQRARDRYRELIQQHPRSAHAAEARRRLAPARRR